MEPTKRQVTIIDELWDNEDVKTNRRLYDEQERGLQRQNVELNDRIKKFERQIEVLKHNQPKDHDKELIKRILSKQGFEYNKLITKKDQEIEQLKEQIKQLSKTNVLESALRQSNIEKLFLEKRLLSSSNATTTTTNADPSTASATSSTEDSPKLSTSSAFSDDPIYSQALHKMNEVLKTEIHRLTHTNEEHTAKIKLQLQQYNELQQTYKQLESKYNQLLDIEERYKKEKTSHESCLQENERLKEKLSKAENEVEHKYLDEYKKQKEKVDLLENDLLTLKSSQDNQEDLQMRIEQLQKELQLSINECETNSSLNKQLRTEISKLTETTERVSNECETLRRSLIAKTDEFDLKQRETEQLKAKNLDLESIIKSLQDANDLQKRINEENERNKQELKKKQDDYEQFQKMHDATKSENQATIHVLQEKIHDLERKTESQTAKYEEILHQLDSLKTRQQHRSLPTSTGNSPSINNSHHSPLSITIDSQASLTDDSAPVSPRQRSKGLNETSARIAMARYSYEPLRFSPNEHPEVELPLKLGEYYIIYGNTDEDGFYDGRNLDGRYGLIPSNFVELVKNPNDLPENKKYLIQKLIGNIFSADDRALLRRESPLSLDSDAFNMNSSLSIPIKQKSANSISSDTTGSDLSNGKHVPYPTNLHVEKLLSNSVLIAWDAPIANIQILGYQIILDQKLYATTHTSEPTRFLIEDINLNEQIHRVSIRAITQLGQSRDQQCTLLLTHSKDLSYIPTDLRVDRINQTSAIVSWWPASNDIAHRLFVDDKEVQIFKAGIYRFKLTNLLPNTIHKVTVKAKPSMATVVQHQLGASIEFRTIAFEESIEPPKRVQATIDSPANTLHVSWEPLSSKSAARGYRVLLDGRQLLDITNPLNDHAIINLNILNHGRFLTIRTLAENASESHDSIPIDLDDVLKKTSHSLSTILSESPTMIGSPSAFKSSINGKEINKSVNRTPRESPSIASSASTDIPQVEYNSNSPKTPIHNKFATKQNDYSESNRIRTPINETPYTNKTTRSAEKRSNATNKNAQIEALPEMNNPFLDKMNAAPRVFLALFDYDPQAMSPNQNSDEELPFKQGEILKIYGDQDADGFYFGQTEDGHVGYIPSNMVSEIDATDSESESIVSNGSLKNRETPTSTPTNSKSKKKMLALFDYNAREHSTNNKNSNDKLTFHSGDVIYVHGNVRSNGFYSGELENGKKGLVPSSYLKEIPDENPMKTIDESTENKQTSINVNSEEKIEKIGEQSPLKISQPPTTDTPKVGLFDRLKTTFSWNLNQPI